MLTRRELLRVGTGGALSLAAAATGVCAASGMHRFTRNYAPQLGSFRRDAGSAPIEQFRFLAAEGFRAIEDTCLRAKSPDFQAQMGRELVRRGMSLVCFTGVIEFGRPIFASGRHDLALEVLREVRSAVDTADRVGGRSFSVVLGKRDASLSVREQWRHAVALLNRCADVCEPRAITLLLEPVDHGPGRSRMFLRSARQAAELCRAVARPSCRILLDLHQQVAAGEDIPRLLRDVRDVLGHVQRADSLCLSEPGTDRLDFARLLTALDAIGYRGALGIDHGSATAGKPGERAIIDAYANLDRCTQRPIA
jgi:hydroxypyruvate isomerase